MIPTKGELISLYRRRAGFYDFTANLYCLVGFRQNAYRKPRLLHSGSSRVTLWWRSVAGRGSTSACSDRW